MNITIQVLTKDYLEQNLEQFIAMLHRTLKDEYWTNEHFLSDLPSKWKFSQYVTNDYQEVIAFLIASEKEQKAHIHKFVVDPSYQKGGLGTRMLKYLQSISSKDITLKVSAQNTEAARFYERKGFVVTGEQNNTHTMILELK